MTRRTLFKELDLLPELDRGVEDAGFVECTPIQGAALPYVLAGEDVAGQAQTGTGKTACFLLGVFTRLLTSGRTAAPHRPRALALAPTRELALQIASDAEIIGKHTGLRFVTVYGGVGYEGQRHGLRVGADLVIATPGRAIDFMRRGELKLDQIEVLVVDEADRMFDMGFIADLRLLLRRCPPKGKRQALLFSATLNNSVMELAWEFMHEVREVAVEPERVVATTVEEVVYHVGRKDKISLLLGLFAREVPERALVFCNRKVDAERVTRRLEQNGFPVGLISGDLAQSRRSAVMDSFKAGELPILVATDVAGRGLHIDGVTHVFNFDVPQDPADYVHRIGRTARMGAQGLAVTLACEEFVLQLPAVETYIGHRIPVGKVTEDLLPPDRAVGDAMAERSRRRRDRGGHGGRMNGAPRSVRGGRR